MSVPFRELIKDITSYREYRVKRRVKEMTRENLQFNKPKKKKPVANKRINPWLRKFVISPWHCKLLSE